MAANPLDLITTNVNVGINEVVAIFVSRYESELYAKKDVISAKIRTLKASIEQITTALTDSVDKSAYACTVPTLNLEFKVTDVKVVFEQQQYCNTRLGIHVVVGLHDKSDENRDYAVYSKTFVLPIDEAMITSRKDLQDELVQANLELVEVMGLIKTVGRKERQIRGKIAEMKMEQAGQTELLNNSDLTKLISMD